MTDPTTDLGEVIINAQRRSSSAQPFPPLPTSIVVPAPYETPEVQKGDPIEMDPCRFMPFRRRWDADAAAVAAVQAFLAEAAALGGGDVGPSGPDLANREFGVPLIGMMGGRVRLGEVSYGLQGTTSVIIDESGVTPFNFRGFVHSHPSGSLVPTPMGPDGSGDWGVFNYFRNQVIAAGLPTDGLTMYLVAYDHSTEGYRVMAFDWGEDGVGEGREVNPDAQPCSD